MASLPALVPGKQEVLIRVRAIGVNPVETYIRAGNYAYTGPWPYTPGHDAAGLVEAVGEGVTRVSPGDRVYTHRTLSGAYAEYALAAEGMVQRLPERLSFRQGAALPTPYYTAYRALFERLHVRPGRTLLVHGATGGVGVAALQLARAHGLHVIGTAGSDDGAALIAPWCHTVLRHGAPGFVDDVLAASPGGRGVHYVLENLANVNLQADLQVVAPMAGAAICVVGSRGDVTVTPRLLMAKEATLTGVMLWGNAGDDWDAAAAHIHAGLAAGTLAPLLGTVYTRLEDAPAAHEEVIAHAGGARGKIVIELP